MQDKSTNRNSPLVSIITPCLNGEKFVHRFLESVLNQTYNNIEIIFINDGSTDKTEEIVLSYEKEFLKKKINFKYIYQENKGQASAINRGLKIFEGEYLTWPDSDDILHRENIEKKVEFLEENPEYGLVLCKSRMLDEDNFEQIGILERIPPIEEDNLFYDLIFENNIYFAPGGYMARTSSFLDVNPSRRIYESRAGQNWQMLLPIAYKYKCGYIDEFLYDYLVRTESHSRQAKYYREKLERTYDHEDILKTVIKEMNIDDEKYYLDLIDRKYYKKRFNIALTYNDKENIEKQYSKLNKNNWVDREVKILYLANKYIILNILYECFRYITPDGLKRKIKKAIL